MGKKFTAKVTWAFEVDVTANSEDEASAKLEKLLDDIVRSNQTLIDLDITEEVTIEEN